MEHLLCETDNAYAAAAAVASVVLVHCADSQWSAQQQLVGGSAAKDLQQQQQLMITASSCSSPGKDVESQAQQRDQQHAMPVGKGPASSFTMGAAAAADAGCQQTFQDPFVASNNSSSNPQFQPSVSAATGGVMAYLYQVWVLMVRFGRCWVRTPIMAGAEAAQTSSSQCSWGCCTCAHRCCCQTRRWIVWVRCLWCW